MKIDFLSLVAENVFVDEFIIRVLGLPIDFFVHREAQVKHKEYTKLYQIGNIKVFGDIPQSEENPLGLGCYLVLSGSGCRDFFRAFSNSEEIDYSSFFRRCNNYRNRNGFLQYHITRLDIAIDDKNEKPFFTIEQLHSKCLKEEFVSSSRTYRFVESSIWENETAKTLYIGDGKSNLSYRFYDKDKEQCKKYEIAYEDMGSWKRTELQLRDEVAHKFAQEMAEQPFMLGNQVFDLLGTSLRFVVPDKNQQNKSRLKTCRFWERFLGTIKPLKITVEQPTNHLYDTQIWLRDGGSLSAVKAFLFLEQNQALGDLTDLNTLMNRLHYSTSLSVKVAAHLQKIGREDLIPILYENTKHN